VSISKHYPKTFPLIETERLHLRQFTLEDAPAVYKICDHPGIASTTQFISSPYSLKEATEWIAPQKHNFEIQWMFIWALEKKSNRQVIGMASLTLNHDNLYAELGYWIDVEHWGMGYATEAASALLKFGFETLRLHRIEANFMKRNPASGRVMDKIGMQYEGLRREAIIKYGQYEDMLYYSILAKEFWLLQKKRLTNVQNSG
jgi:[ribosomal protein S5]-alanine N-acetyltransferase